MNERFCKQAGELTGNLLCSEYMRNWQAAGGPPQLLQLGGLHL